MRSPILLVILSLLAALTAPAHAQQTPPGTAPGAAPEIARLKPGTQDAKPLTLYQWTAEAGATDEHDGFRFTWRLPKDFTRTEPYDLVVVCHGVGQDYRWGGANLKPDLFRTNNIVVCVDGTSEAEDSTRVFNTNRRDAIEFRDFVLEMSRSFPVDRIFLYGHSQGSFFVAFMATQFPGLTEGIVADSSSAWGELNLKGGIQSVPVAFIHGTADAVVPYFNSLAARDALDAAEHQMFLVRRLQGHDHRPSAARASECIDWCSGMSTTQADTALAAAEALLRPIAPDEHALEYPVAFGAAIRVLRRVTLETENHVEESDDAQKAKARALLERIDAEGAKHVEILRKDVKSAGDLVLGLGADSGAWLGHLVALREDFRGVPSVEAYIKEIGYDEAAHDQREAARKLLDVWYAVRPEKQKFEVVTETLGDCFLVDGFPSDLEAQMNTLKAKSADLQLTDESLEKLGVVETWSTAWKNGTKRYLELCKQWK